MMKLLINALVFVLCEKNLSFSRPLKTCYLEFIETFLTTLMSKFLPLLSWTFLVWPPGRYHSPYLHYPVLLVFSNTPSAKKPNLEKFFTVQFLNSSTWTAEQSLADPQFMVRNLIGDPWVHLALSNTGCLSIRNFSLLSSPHDAPAPQSI